MTTTEETDAAATSCNERGANVQKPILTDDLPSLSDSEDAHMGDATRTTAPEGGSNTDDDAQQITALGPSRVKKIVEFPSHPPQLTGKLIELKDIVEPQHPSLQ